MYKILCIDDEPSLLELLLDELDDEGYETLQALDGKAGLSVILQHKPDLIVCDLMMPEMDGMTLLKTLRRDHPEFDYIPFIFLSALNEREQVLEGLEVGADEYLTKPIDFEVLLATIRKSLRFSERMRAKAERDHVKIYRALTENDPEGNEPDQEAPFPRIAARIAIVGTSEPSETGLEDLSKLIFQKADNVKHFESGKEYLDELDDFQPDITFISPTTSDIQSHIIFRSLEGLPESRTGLLVLLQPEGNSAGIAQSYKGDTAIKKLTIPVAEPELVKRVAGWMSR